MENLLNLFALRMRDPNLLMEESQVQEGLHRQAETSGVGDSDSHVNTMKSKLYVLLSIMCALWNTSVHRSTATLVQQQTWL